MASSVTTVATATSSSVSSSALSAAALAQTTSAATSTSTTAASGSSDSITLSANAQRLLEAESNLSADEESAAPGELASQWNNDLAKSVNLSDVPAADAEVARLPTSDPAHIAQAEAAQAYVKSVFSATLARLSTVPNPFSGLSQTALSAIANDSTGLYTSYEKSAAMYASVAQTNAWVQQYQGADQENDKGFFEEAQLQYSNLSALQQSVYPSDYVANLKVAAQNQWTGEIFAAPTSDGAKTLAQIDEQEVENWNMQNAATANRNAGVLVNTTA